MLVNFDLQENGPFPACRAADRIRLSRRVHAAVEPGQGQISSRRSRGLDLEIRRVSAAAQWLEVGVRLERWSRWLPDFDRVPGVAAGVASGVAAGVTGSREGWLSCRRFICRLCLALQPEEQPKDVVVAADGTGDGTGDGDPADPGSAPPLQARLALRLQHRGGFEDVFAAKGVPLRPEADWSCVEIAPPICALDQAQGLDLHLFLPPGSGDLQIRALAVTGLQ